MPDSKLKDLFKKYLENNLTTEEFSQLYETIRSGYDPTDLDELIEATFSDPAYAVPAEDNKKEVFASLLAKIEEKDHSIPATPAFTPAPIPVVPLYRRRGIAGAAAAILILTAGSLYWLAHRRNIPAQLVAEQKTIKFDAPPGRSGATLTLANGQHIELDSTQNGALTQQGNARLLKKGSKLSYEAQDRPAVSTVLYNSITTPRGRQFELVLADGTHVSLNAASSIRFPTAFTGKERRVEVSGEVYFEVAKNASMPFVVALSRGGTLPPAADPGTGHEGAEIQVLGTHFNVSDYNDENNISATLLEGSIKVSSGTQQIILTPGEQGKIDRGTSVLSHQKVDVDEVVAWTKGRLAISNSDLPTLMRQISRWYDVDVAFQGKSPNIRFGGFLHRDVNLSTLLDYLGENGVHYKTEGKTITILP
jgi:ferric-dicitrate binding protein FerR (iron transport regulator)